MTAAQRQTFERITAAVAAAFDCGVPEIMSRERSGNRAAFVRGVAMLFCKEIAGAHDQELGVFFNRHRCSAYHQMAQTMKALEVYPADQARVDAVRAGLYQTCPHCGARALKPVNGGAR